MQSLHHIRQLPEEQALWYYISTISPNKYWWQVLDMLTTLRLRKVVWIRTRGGSKTDDAADLAVFMAIRYGRGGWYSSESGQLEEARLRIEDNPFIGIANERRAVLIDGTRILFGNYNGKRGLRGPRNMWIISDEEGEILMDRKIQAGYDAALGTLSNTISPIVLHMGTCKVGSKLEENSRLLPTLIRTPVWCNWVNTQQYDYMPQWWKDNELWGKFTVSGGAVFKNLIQHTLNSKDIEMAQTQGVDFNGSVGNIGVRMCEYPDHYVVTQERAFEFYKQDVDLIHWAQGYPTEVESGGWNTAHMPPALQYFPNAAFTNQLKGERIFKLLRKPIYIDPTVTPNVWKDCQRAYWKDEKVDTNDLHYLAALMHAVGVSLQRYQAAQGQRILLQESKREKQSMGLKGLY